MRGARWRRRRRTLLLGVGILSAALGVVAYATGVFHRVELASIDARFQVRGSRPSQVNDLLVVGIDSRTLNDFYDRKSTNWPFPRRDDARVINNLVKAGAKRIGVDLQFTQRTDDADDNDLAEAVAGAGHVVLATNLVGPHGSTDVLGGNANLRTLGHSIPGNSTVISDSDGSLRRMQYEYQGLETFGAALAAETGDRAVTPQLFGGPTAKQPIDYAGPPQTVPSLSYSQVYAGNFPKSMVKGKIVIIGATDPILQDVHITPTSGSGSNGELMSGPEVQANIVATILHGIPLRFSAGWVNVLLIICLGFLAPLLGLRGWALRALAGAVIAGGLFALAVQLTFNSGRIVAFVAPEFALVLGSVGTLGVVYLGEAFERQYARSTFARFVPPDVVDQVLASTDDDLRLTGVERVCTVMFSDLRGFTQFSETQPVDRVIAVVNHYLNEMTEAILEAGGTLIAYMGDGIMAVFGAPLEQDDHAERGLRAAREMIGPRLSAFNAWLAEEGYQSGLRMGVGLNTGPVMCGNVGAEQRVEYTAIGDTTNTASRLEGMTKGTEHMLFVSESTRAALAEVPQDLVFVDELEIRGREAKMRVHSILDPEQAAEPAGKTQ